MPAGNHRSSIAQALGLRPVGKNIGGRNALSRLNIQKIYIHAALGIHAVHIVFQLLNLTGHQQAVLLFCDRFRLKDSGDFPSIHREQVTGTDRRVRLVNLHGVIVNALRSGILAKGQNVFLKIKLAVVVAVYLRALAHSQTIRQNGVLLCRRYLLIRAEFPAREGDPPPFNCNFCGGRVGTLSYIREIGTAVALEAHKKYGGLRRKVPCRGRVRLKRRSLSDRDQAIGGRSHDGVIIGAVFRNVAVIVVRILGLCHGEGKGLHHRGYPFSSAELHLRNSRLLRDLTYGIEKYDGAAVPVADKAGIPLHAFRSYRDCGLPPLIFQLHVPSSPSISQVYRGSAPSGAFT